MYHTTFLILLPLFFTRQVAFNSPILHNYPFFLRHPRREATIDFHIPFYLKKISR